MKQRKLKGIVITTLAVVLTLATSGAVLAYSSGPPPEHHPVPATDSGSQPVDGSTSARNCHTRYRNGAGANHLNWCFSDDGNISHLEHGDNIEHVEVGTLVEGWCVAAEGSQRGITWGLDANEGLNPPTYPSPDKVRHNTTDGSLRVESRFSTSPGNKQIVVKMNVRNNTDSPLSSVFLTRFVDADMANTTGSDEFTSTVRSVTAHEPGTAMLQLFPKTTDYGAASLLWPTYLPSLDSDCYDIAADANLSLPSGDGSMGVNYHLGTIFPGQTRTVQFVYRISN